MFSSDQYAPSSPLKSKFFLAIILFVLLTETLIFFMVLHGIDWISEDFQKVLARELGPSVQLPHHKIQMMTESYSFYVMVSFVITLGIILTVFYFLLRHWVFEPVNLILKKDGQVRNGDMELIPSDQIPSTELGLIMRSRNSILMTLDELFHQEAIATLVEAVDAKDEYTRGHSRRVALLAEKIGKEYGLNDASCANLRRSGVLHDIGKIGINDQILTKEGPLTDREQEIVQKHPSKGIEIIKLSKLDQEILDGIKYHHERYDGNGYPQGLQGGDIPLFGRILSVSDAVDAMLSNRHYRSRLTVGETIEEIKENQTLQFDPDIAEIAIHLLKTGMVIDLWQANAWATN